MGYGGNGSGVNCGTAGTPTLQNIQSNLIDIGNTDIAGLATGATVGFYWSSTEYSGYPQGYAWAQVFESGGNSGTGPDERADQFGVRCSRALTQ